MSRRKFDGSGFNMAARVKELRRERGLTQRGLADSVGVSPSWVSNLEDGKVSNPGVYHVYKLALALRVPMEEIMGVSRLAGRTRMRRDFGDKPVDEILKEFMPLPIPSPEPPNEAGG